MDSFEKADLLDEPSNAPGWGRLSLYFNDNLIAILKYHGSQEINHLIYTIVDKKTDNCIINEHASKLSGTINGPYTMVTTKGDKVNDFSHLSMSDVIDNKYIGFRLFPVSNPAIGSRIMKLFNRFFHYTGTR